MKRLLNAAASLKLTVVCLLLLGVLTVWGTVYQAGHGLYAARQLFFGSWFFLVAGVVPAPGVPAVSLALFVNLLASMAVTRGEGARRIGLWLVHAGLVILLLGGFATARLSRESTLTLAEGEASNAAISDAGGKSDRVPLPVTIRLVDFQKEFYPGSDLPKSFASRIVVESAAGPREVTISMNRPFRYGAFTFYQASYEDRGGREASTLAVSENRARWLPYVATVVIFLGLALHFGRRPTRPAPPVVDAARPPSGAIAIATALVVAAFVVPAFLPYRGPVPLESFSRLPVLDGGRVMPLDTFARSVLVSVSGRSSAERHPAIAWLARVLFAPEHASGDRVFLVSNPDVFDALGLAADRPRRRCTFVELHQALRPLQELAVRAADVPAQDLSPAERDALRLSISVGNYLDLFCTPRVAEAMASAATNGSSVPVADLLVAAGEAYRAGNADEFQAAVAAISSPAPRLHLEVWANRFNAFGHAKLLYGLAFVLALTFGVARWPTWSVLLAALALHTAGLVLRVAIMGRPPVTNLYSTFVFVGWVCALLGVVVERRARNNTGLIAGAAGGFLPLLVAGRYAFEGDPMGHVTAVLNSNLWLTAHVLSVMLGFAGCLMATVVAHVYLVQARRGEAGAAAADRIFGALVGMLAFGLTFTFLGTMLGGVWADQAWGRFWGWDPKENGALVVILWCAILFHARAANLVGRRGLAVGCVLCGVIVAFAWVGVNLLGVGLHSYGWTSGAAAGLCALVAGEGLFLAGTLVPRATI